MNEFSELITSRSFSRFKVVLVLFCGFLTLDGRADAGGALNPTYVLSTFAGRPGGAGHVDGDGATARFGTIAGITADPAGNVYVIDQTTIRKVTPGGTVRTIAGQWSRWGTNDGPGSLALFGPFSGYAQFQGLTVDTSGNIFVADAGNGTIRKISPDGFVSTFAGRPRVFGTNDGPRMEATFGGLRGVVTDGIGNLWVTDIQGNGGHIRKITPDGVVSTLQTRTPALDLFAFKYPDGIVVAPDGMLYIADPGNTEAVWRVDATGLVTSATTNLSFVTNGSVTGANETNFIWLPSGLTVDPHGDLIVSREGGDFIQKIGPSYAVKILAGKNNVPGSNEGPGPEARFRGIRGIASDAAGNIYVADTGNNCIRKITLDGLVTTLAGLAGGREDGPRNTARFLEPQGITLDQTGNIYVADTLNDTVRKITADGQVSTIAGTAGHPRTCCDLNSLLFSSPTSVATDKAGNLYLLDSLHPQNTVWKIATNGTFSTLPNIVGQAYHIAVASDGTIYLSGAPPWPGSNLWKVRPGSTELAPSGYQDGRLAEQPDASTARFLSAAGIALDSKDNLYVADLGNFAIRKITPDGTVSTIAGQPGRRGWNDGPVSEAEFFAPVAVAVSSEGALYILDNGDTLRRLSTNGVVTTIKTIGGIGKPYIQQTAAGLLFSGGDVSEMAIDPLGNLYFVNASDNTIKIAKPATEAVDLKVAASEKGVALSWLASAASLRLETTTNISDPLSWYPIQSGIVTNGNSLVVTNPAVEPTRTYRLCQP